MAFYKHDWYFDPTDHRCPHDAWLDSICISEVASGARQEVRVTKIIIRLLGAYHDGYISLMYSNVHEYYLDSSSLVSGHGDWVSDDISSEDSRVYHNIRWSGGIKGPITWRIVAESVSFAWDPIISSQSIHNQL